MGWPFVLIVLGMTGGGGEGGGWLVNFSSVVGEG